MQWRWGGGGGGGVFSWQSNSLQTTVHPLFPLHLDFRWPILHRVVTLETAPHVFIKRDWVDMEKGSRREDVDCDTGSAHDCVQNDGRAVLLLFCERLFNRAACDHILIYHLAVAASCPLYRSYKMLADRIGKYLDLKDPALYCTAEVIIVFLQLCGSESLSAHLPSALKYITSFLP